MKTNVNVRENYLEKEEEKDAGASSPNVQTISKMENVIVDAVTREDVVREHLNVNVSLANLSNGILLPKLFWPTVRKIVLVIEKNFWNSRLKAKNLQNFWDH